MRRVALALALLLASTIGRVEAQGVVFGVGGQLTGELNTRIRVPVYADLRAVPGVRLGSYTLRLTWDPSVLEFTSVLEGTFGQPVVYADSAYFGVLKVGGLSPAGMEGLFDLFAADFLIWGGGTTSIALGVTEAAAAGTFADLTAQVTAVGSTYCPAVGRWGDLDADGDANSRDALAILSALVGLPVDSTFTLALGDVDGDALVNSRDALITLSYAVGLDIPGQRVLVLAPGAACAADGAAGVTILPDTVDIAVGQEVRLLLSGAVAGLPAGTTVNWAVGNPEIAIVTADGTVAGRAAGTTTVTAALGPGIATSVPVIVRARRGTWHVDAGRAAFAGIQLGTSRYPFATPQYAFPIVQDNDTIRIAPGTHDYLGGDLCTGGFYEDTPPGDGEPPPAPPPEQCARYGELARSAVMLGDTLANGTRPVLRGNPEADQAVSLHGPIRFEMRDLELRGFDETIYLGDPVRTIEVENVRFDLTSPAASGGFILYYGLDTLILRDVEFIGDTAEYATAVDLEDGAGLVLFDRVIVDGVPEGFYLYGVDSLDIRDSRMLTSDGGLYVTSSSAGTRAYLTRNVFQTLYDSPVGIYEARSVTSAYNVYRLGGSYTGLEVYGRDYPAQPGSRFRSLGDSVVLVARPGTVYDYAISISDLDTIVVDSAVVTAPDSGLTLYPGYLYGGTLVRMEGSRFTNVSGSPLYLGGRSVSVTNSVFTPCRLDCSTGYGLYAEGYGDSVALLEVLGNTFDGTYTAVQANYGEVHRVVAVGNTLDSVNTGFLLAADSVVLTDNVVTRAGFAGGSALQLTARASRPSTATLLQRNRISASLGGYALYAQTAHVASAGNRYAGAYGSVYLYNASGSGWQLSLDRDTVTADSAQGGVALQVYGSYVGSLRRSRIEGGGYGLYATLTDGSFVLDSNVVTGTRAYGMQLSASAGASFTGRWNNVTSNAGYGIQTSGAATFSFTDGRFVGNRAYAVQAVSGSVVDATNNWWGNPGGPGGGIADSVQFSVTTSPFLTTDPAGVSVPPLAPAGAPVADLWRASAGSRGALRTEPSPTMPRNDRAERDAWRQARRAEAAARFAERRAALDQRTADHPTMPRR
jgi:hypothetical protein